ncbi:hypothetical protein MY11210_009715 [Beauveria gryllotalpidicola]
MQWQCTPAGDPQPDALLLRTTMTLKRFPTVILHDAVGLFRTDQITQKYYDPSMQVFVRGLNLYIASQNRKVSPSKQI